MDLLGRGSMKSHADINLLPLLLLSFLLLLLLIARVRRILPECCRATREDERWRMRHVLCRVARQCAILAPDNMSIFKSKNYSAHEFSCVCLDT
jgi:hypothetical protein